MRYIPTELVQITPSLFGKWRGMVIALILAHALPAVALEELGEDDLRDTSGAGIALPFDDFSFRMAPTSYIELTGLAPKAGSSAESYGWKRGDARYYGLSFSYGAPCNVGTGPGTGSACAGAVDSLGVDWAGNSATIAAGSDLLSYPIGMKSTPGTSNPYGVVGFASVYNPFVLRVFQYKGYDYAGVYRDTASGATAMPTVLEFAGPSKTDPWRWAFWGEMLVNAGSTTGCPAGGNTVYCGLQSQTIIHGSPTASGQTWLPGTTTFSAVPAQRRASILRLMQTRDTTTGAPAGNLTLGIAYQSALSGNFRFSVQQENASPNTLHSVPTFDTSEGLYFKNVDAFMPLGVLHSQALIANGSSTYNSNGVLQTSFQQNGNFVLELSRIPNNANVYNAIYCGATPLAPTCAVNATAGATNGMISNPNPETHGYVRWGDWISTAAGGTTQINPYTATPGTGPKDLPSATSTANGIYFRQGDGGAVVNLGISRVEGMLIQHLKISSLGGGI